MAVVQALITVPTDTAAVSTQGPEPSFNFLVDGEVLRQAKLFESFRYRFDIPSAEVGSDELPLIIQRYLRPNEYTLVVKVEDLNSHRVFRIEQKVQVPVVQTGRRPAVVASAPVEPVDRAVGADLQEANQPLVYGDHSLKILPPSGQLHTDRLRVETVTRGQDIAKVSFILNGKPVLAKTRPPYSVELDLGRAPRLHTLEAVAYDAEGSELARDRIPINAGPHRFAVRLLEPRPGRHYERSLRAWAEVDVPLGDSLDRLEFYLNETRLASLYQPPFVQPILIPEGQRITYVRALAVLADGNATEDVVFINTPANFDVLQIHFVELYTSVVDRRGRPVEGLSAEDFVVLEDGVEQELARFEKVTDLPIHAGIVLDTSTSMAEELREAVRGGLRFFESVIRPQDRAAVVVFNDQPDLRVPFTNKLDVLAGGLANLTAEGETALFDTLVYTLHYFAGLKGKRALILLSDGQDSASRHSFDDTLEFARRTGVAIYTIGINLAHRDVLVRSQLQRLARETAGHFFFIRRASELKSIYTRIEEELRTQYFLGYQSSGSSSDAFRKVEVRLKQTGLEAKTIPGYYP